MPGVNLAPIVADGAFSATLNARARGGASPFDALASTHNLEHFREADRAFERMVSMLAPGGKLYIEVPDQSDLYVPGHLWHFTGETLRLWTNALALEDVQVDVRYPSGRPNLHYHLAASRG